jgi:hypothetical protein
MALQRTLIRQIRNLDEYDLRRLLIFIRGLLVQHGPEGDADATPGSRPGKVSYRLEGVKCGKPGCTRCPHGPYWYAYWREGGRVRSRYIGRRHPDEGGVRPTST